jgi:hypothetical protein
MKPIIRFAEFLIATVEGAPAASNKIAADLGNPTNRGNTASGSTAVWNSNVFVNRSTEVWRSTAVWGSLSQNSAEQATSALHGE